MDPEHPFVREALEAGDVQSWIIRLGSERALAAVSNNAERLNSMGQYEVALVQAWSGISQGTLLPWTTHALGRLLNAADPRLLLSAGDPPPPGPYWRVYRGVSGASSRERRANGFSWTMSLDVALWFAMWKKRERPAIYWRDVTAAEVYFYTDDRKEQEFVCRLLPWKPQKLGINLEEMRRRSDAENERRRDLNTLKLASLASRKRDRPGK